MFFDRLQAAFRKGPFPEPRADFPEFLFPSVRTGAQLPDSGRLRAQQVSAAGHLSTGQPSNSGCQREPGRKASGCFP